MISIKKVSHQLVKEELAKTILSASGWRKIFAASGDEEDHSQEIGDTNSILSILMADIFADFIRTQSGKNTPLIALGMDARPTGISIADCFIRVFLAKGIEIQFLEISAAPEIMAYARALDGFAYISASHNPIGHNGVKFGLNDGGVIPGTLALPLANEFKTSCERETAIDYALSIYEKCKQADVEKVYAESPQWKAAALSAYTDFTRQVVSGEDDTAKQQELFKLIAESTKKTPLTIVCDMNGSARTKSIDQAFLNAAGLGFAAINNVSRQIVHAIIPEPENLVYCAEEMEKLQKGTGSVPGVHPEALLGYMPDCDGDRGNIVYWDEKSKKAQVLQAQEVFALSVLAETAYSCYKGELTEGVKAAVAVNDPTSMRVDDIAACFGLEVYRAEVGEANVVNLARSLREQGYLVRILGEGSNGGNITHPAAVRDPLNTIFALVKLLVIRDTTDKTGAVTKKGLFHLWCERSGQEQKYKSDFTLTDVIATLPSYTTTGVSEPRALAKISTTNHKKLKSNYENIFKRQWHEKTQWLHDNWGITDWEGIANNGIKETRNLSDFSVSAKGGLKILLKNASSEPIAFIWMRGSGTEPVFRVMCDVKGNKPQMEAELLEWHAAMIEEADEK